MKASNVSKVLKLEVGGILAGCMLLTACGEGANSQVSGGSTGTKQTEVAKTTEKQTEAAKTTEKQTEETKNKEAVELEWYLALTKRPGEEEVFKKVNEILKEELNTTINIHTYKSSEYDSAVSTMVSSGIPMDIVFTGNNVVDFATFSAAGAFAPIEDLVDEYLPKTKAQLSKGAWEAFTYDGHVYAVPTNKDLAANQVFDANQTMIDDLGVPFPGKWDTAYDLVDWVYKVKEARDKKYPDRAQNPLFKRMCMHMSQWYHYEALVGATSKTMIAVNVPGLKGFEGQGNGETVFCPFFTKEYEDFIKVTRDLVKANIIPFDSDTFDQDLVLFKKGELLGGFGEAVTIQNENMNAPYYKTRQYPSDHAVMTTSYVREGANAISSQSKNIERALEALELINSDNYLATVIRFGVEGEQEGWTDKDNDRVIELGAKNQDPSNRYYYQWYGWQIGSITAGKYPPDYPSNFGDLVKELNDNSVQDTNLGFSLLQDPVANEIAACNNVMSEYSVLTKGRTDDYLEQIEQFRKKLKDNGIDKVIEEAQKQLNEWRKSVGKATK